MWLPFRVIIIILPERLTSLYQLDKFLPLSSPRRPVLRHPHQSRSRDLKQAVSIMFKAYQHCVRLFEYLDRFSKTLLFREAYFPFSFFPIFFSRSLSPGQRFPPIYVDTKTQSSSLSPVSEGVYFVTVGCFVAVDGDLLSNNLPMVVTTVDEKNSDCPKLQLGPPLTF